MGAIEVSAKKGDNACVESYDFGDNLADMTGKFNEDVVFSQARAHMKIVLQAGLRRALEAGQSTAEFAAKFIPGIQTAAAAVDPIVAMKAKFATMDEDAKRAYLKELKDSI